MTTTPDTREGLLSLPMPEALQQAVQDWMIKLTAQYGQMMGEFLPLSEGEHQDAHVISAAAEVAALLACHVIAYETMSIEQARIEEVARTRLADINGRTMARLQQVGTLARQALMSSGGWPAARKLN